MNNQNQQHVRFIDRAWELFPQDGLRTFLGDEDYEALTCTFPDSDVEISRDTGLLYIPGYKIIDRLNTVLGHCGWTTIMDGFPKIEGDCVTVKLTLVIRGSAVGEGFGACRLMGKPYTLADSIDGAVTDAIRRIAGKRLGIGSQVWCKEYCRSWIAKYAKKSVVNGRTVWEKNLSAFSKAESRPADDDAQPHQPAAPHRRPTHSTPATRPQAAPARHAARSSEGSNVAEVWPNTVPYKAVIDVGTISVSAEPTETKTGKRTPWRFTFVSNNGEELEFSSFSDSIARVVRALENVDAKAEVCYVKETRGKFSNLRIVGVRSVSVSSKSQPSHGQVENDELENAEEPEGDTPF